MTLNSDMPTLAQISDLLKDGLSIIQIARHFGCDRGSISRRIARGADIGPGGKPARFDKIEIRRLRSEGKTMYEIASLLGCSPALVCIYAKDVPLPDGYVERLKDRHMARSARGPNKHSQRARDNRLHLFDKYTAEPMSASDYFMAGLYAGEGGKTNGRFSISNANPSLVQFVVKYVIGKGVINSDILASVYVHAGGLPASKVAEYWCNCLSLPTDRVRVSIKKATLAGRFRYTLPYGTVLLTLRGCHSIPMFERIRAVTSNFAEPEGKLFTGDADVHWKNHDDIAALTNKKVTEATCLNCGKLYAKAKPEQRFCCQKCASAATSPAKPFPSKAELLDLLGAYTKVAIARQYSVSDATVCNWCRRYGIPLSDRSKRSRIVCEH